MKKAKFNAWVRMKNAKNIQQSLSLYINTSNVGPALYLVPVKSEGYVNIVVKNDDEGIDENIEHVDDSGSMI